MFNLLKKFHSPIHPASSKVQNLIKKVSNSNIGRLENQSIYMIFCALLEWNYTKMRGHEKQDLWNDFGGDKTDNPNNIIEYISAMTGLGKVKSVSVLGEYFGMSPEYISDVFPPSTW